MKRWTPVATEIEEALLTTMVFDHDSAVLLCGMLEPDDFYYEKNQKVFSAVVSLVRESKGVDPFLVLERLKTQNQMSHEQAESYIMGVTKSASYAAFQEDMADVLRDHNIRRQAVTESLRLAEAAHDPQKTNAEVLDAVQKVLALLTSREARGGLKSFQQLTPPFLDWLERLEAGELPGTVTGMRRFDSFFGSLAPGELVVLGARPGIGKTSLALALLIECARSGQAGAFFSLEMKARELFLRAYCRERNLDISSFRAQSATEVEKSFLREAAASMRSFPLYIDETKRRTPLQIKAGIQQLRQKHPVALVAVDFLTLMKPDGKHESRRHEIGYCARALKDIAGEMDTTILLLSQLNRELEHDQREPRLADLRETGEIEEAADIVMLLDRPIVRKKEADPRLARILVPKFRNGADGWFKMTFEKRCAGFFDWIEPHFLEGIEYPNLQKISREVNHG